MNKKMLQAAHRLAQRNQQLLEEKQRGRDRLVTPRPVLANTSTAKQDMRTRLLQAPLDAGAMAAPRQRVEIPELTRWEARPAAQTGRQTAAPAQTQLNQAAEQLQQSRDARLIGHTEQDLASAINARGQLPQGTRWLNQGDSAVVVRDFAHRPIAGAVSEARANAGLTAERDYREAVKRANAAYANPVDRYGTKYGDAYRSWDVGRAAVEAGETDPEYTAYHGRLGEQLAEINALHDQAEALRPEWMQDELLRTAHMSGYTPGPGWDASNKYDDNPALRRQLWSDQRATQQRRDTLSGQIAQLEGMGFTGTGVEGMRSQLSDMDDDLQQMEYTMLDSKADFRQVVDAAKANGYNPGSNESLLRAVTDTDAQLEKAVAQSGGMQPNVPAAVDQAAAMTQAEKDRFVYLWQTEGEQAAADYFASVTPTVNQRRSMEMQQTAYDIASGSALGAVGMTLLDALATPVKSAGLLSTGINALRGEETDPYSSAFALTHIGAGSITGAKQKALSPFLAEDGSETTASKIAGVGFDMLHNTANNLLNMIVSGPLALPAMALASGSDTAMDSLLRSDGKSGMSFFNGLGAAAAEYVTEKLPMDQLGEMLAGNRKGIGAIIAHSFSEAPGEMASTILSEASDRSIMGAYSNYNLSIDRMMEQGMSREEAENTAKSEFWREVCYSGLVGWLSAGLSGTVTQAIGSTGTRNADAPGNLQRGIDAWRAKQAAEMQGQVAQLQPQEAAPDAQQVLQQEAVPDAQQVLQQAAEDTVVQQQKQVEAARPVQFEERHGEGTGTGNRFAQPLEAQTIDGDAVQVEGIEQDSDGMPYLIVRDAIGDERSEPINAVNIADETVQELLHADAARGMDSKALTGMMSSYDGSVPADIYAQAYGYAYRRGNVNASFAEATPDTVREVLSQQAQMDAYTAGLDRYHSRQAQTVAQPAERTAADVRQPASRGGVVRAYTQQAWAAMPKEQRKAAAAQIEVVGAIGRRVGRQIRIVDSITTADGQRVNGRYNTSTGEIEVALNADAGAYSYVAMHELTHDLKTNHADQWDGFGRIVTEALAANGVDVDAAIAYQQQAFGYDAETALEEVICNTAPAVLQNENVLEDLYTKDKTLFERVRDWVQNLINDIRKAGESLSQRSRSWQQMDALTGDADALQQIYDKMMAIYEAGTEAEAETAAVAESPTGITTEMIEQEIVEGMQPSVMEAPVDADSKQIRYSVSTYEQEMPKPIGVARAKALGFDTTKGSTAIKRLGRNGKRTLMASGRDVTAALLQKEGHSKKTIRKVLGYMDTVSKWFRDNVGKYRYVNLADVNNADIIIDRKTGQILFSCQVPNGEYKVNFDFTTVCRQREAIQRFVDELSAEKGKRGSKLEDISLSPENIFKLNVLLKDAGYETACLGCFVEAKRYRIMSKVNTIVSEWNDAVRAINPNAEFFGFADAEYKPGHDEIIKLDNAMSQYTSKGSGAKTPTQRAQHLIGKVPEMQKLLRPSDIISREGRRAIREMSPALESFVVSRFGAAGAKPAVGFMPYNSEIAALPDTKKVDGKKISYAEYLASMGGGRTNSFSDFVITHALDYLQRTVDMAARGFTGQCYTKVLGRAMLYGMTGEKVNMSVMFDIDPDVHWSSAGLDADGNYIVADKARADRMEAEGKGRTFTQSIPYEEAVAIEHDPRYADNCGIIGVGYSYNHIVKMIEDGNFPYIIPYHRSGMPDSVAKASHTGHATNYEPVQNTTKLVGYQRVLNMGESGGVPSYATWPEGKKKPRKADMSFDFAGSMKRTGSAAQTMQEWQAWMAENDLTPMTESGEAGHGDFALYETLEQTNSPEQTAEAYMAYCLEKGMLPVFYEFAGMDGYYKTLFDFSVKNLVTGETSTQKAMGFDWMDEVPAEDFVAELEREMHEYDDYMRDRYGERSKWAEIKQRAYEEMQPQSEDDTFKRSMSDYNDDARAAEDHLGALMAMTAGHTLTDSEADRLANRVINAVGSTVDRDTLAWRLKDALRSVQGMGRHEVAGALYAEMMPIAQDVLDSSMRADTVHEERVKPLRQWLHEHPLALTKAQKAMAEEISGSYVDFKRQAKGVRMSLNAGNTLDTVYAKLTEFDPAAYPAEATEREKVAKLLDAGESVQKVYVTGMGADESVRWMADKILNTYFTLTGVQRDAQNPTSFATALRNYRNAIGAYEKTSNDLFDEALSNVLERYGRKIERGDDFDLSKLVATDEGKELYRHVLSEKQRNLRRRIEDNLRRQQRTAQIYRQSRDLLKKLERPTDKKHVQDALQGELTRFLKAINFGSANNTTRNLAARIRALRDVMSDQNRQDTSLPYLFDPDMAEQMRVMAARLEELPSMNEMSDSELAELRQMIAYVSHVVATADESFAEGRKLKISAVAGQSLDELQGRKNAKDREGWGEKLHNFLNIGQLDAFHYFDLLGNGGKKMFAALRKGLDRKIRHWAEATDYANDVIAALPKAGRKDLFAGKKAPKTSFELANGTLNLSKAQIMELYCLSKRKNALLHLYEGGIRAGDGAKARSVLVTPAEVESITDTLTAAEKQVADKLQQYMATECGAWGNETSLQLYGYRKFGEADYYPMRVDPNSVDSGISEEGRNDNLYAILNMGMTKSLQEGAHNALYIGDIFDTFAKHVDNMSKYNGFAAPVADLIRWYNYRAGGDQNIQYMLESKFGKAGRDYIPTLIRNLNGERDRSYNPGLTSAMFSHMKAGSVGRNLRVVIQQPTAILRAGDMMDYKYIVAGMVDPQKPADRTRLTEAIELAKQYSPIAKLKSMGFFETDVGNSLRTAMFDDRTAMDKVKDEGMWLAGKMDEMTFGMLWRACEAEARALHPELTGEAFYEAVGQRLSDVIDYTQVVDTTLHRSQLMRSGNALVRMSTTFMSEPTKTYNMLYSSLRRMLDNRKDPIAKKHFARTIGVFTLTGIVNAMAQSLIDAMRDDSDDEWWRKFLKHYFGDYSNLGEGWLQKLKNVAREALLDGNVGGNLNVGTMIPYVKDALSLMQGYDLNRTDMQSVEKLVQTAGQVGKLLTGDSTMSGWAWAKQIAGSVDSVTGLGLGNALRDGYAVTNLLFGLLGKESPISMKSEDATSTIAYDNLYKALMSGDRRRWDRLTDKMLGKGKVTKEIDSAMADRLAEESRIGEAYAAREAGYGSKVDRIRQEMMDQLPDWLPESRRREIVDKAINKLNPATTQEKDDKPLNSKLYSYDDLSAVFAGFANGTHTMEDYNLIISELVSDSTAADPGKTVQTNAKSQAKAAYKAATAEQRVALGEIIKSLFGLDDDDLRKWLEN